MNETEGECGQKGGSQKQKAFHPPKPWSRTKCSGGDAGGWLVEVKTHLQKLAINGQEQAAQIGLQCTPCTGRTMQVSNIMLGLQMCLKIKSSAFIRLMPLRLFPIGEGPDFSSLMAPSLGGPQAIQSSNRLWAPAGAFTVKASPQAPPPLPPASAQPARSPRPSPQPSPPSISSAWDSSQSHVPGPPPGSAPSPRSCSTASTQCHRQPKAVCWGGPCR